MFRNLVRRLYEESRRRKFLTFMRELQPQSTDWVLDVGAECKQSNPFSNLFEVQYPYPERLVALTYGDPSAIAGNHDKVRFVCGDGRRLPFRDKSFDIVVSNAVIEHVGGAKEQAQFIRELCRVGKKCFITTPNRHYPVELHSKVPFVQYMPEGLRNVLLRKARSSYLIPQWGKEFNLLSARKFRALFPNEARVRILKQCVTLFAETLIAIVETAPGESGP